MTHVIRLKLKLREGFLDRLKEGDPIVYSFEYVIYTDGEEYSHLHIEVEAGLLK